MALGREALKSRRRTAIRPTKKLATSFKLLALLAHCHRPRAFLLAGSFNSSAGSTSSTIASFPMISRPG